jgi:hypothetical protein
MFHWNQNKDDNIVNVTLAKAKPTKTLSTLKALNISFF